MKRALGWILATLVVAAVTHYVTLKAVPGRIMESALSRMGAPNAIHHGVRVTAASRGVVRPSPDLLYSTCPFDLSKGALHITASMPTDTYWSVSMFDDDTNNFFVKNDRQVKGGHLDIVLMPDAPLDKPLPKGAMVVHAPSLRGLVLFRTLINDDHRFAAIDKARRSARCAPF
jgi:uncharacterized membrane protein